MENLDAPRPASTGRSLTTMTHQGESGTGENRGRV